MPDVVRALLISASVLLGVVVLMTLVASAAVKRGEAAMAEDEKSHRHGPH